MAPRTNNRRYKKKGSSSSRPLSRSHPQIDEGCKYLGAQVPARRQQFYIFSYASIVLLFPPRIVHIEHMFLRRVSKQEARGLVLAFYMSSVKY